MNIIKYQFRVFILIFLLSFLLFFNIMFVKKTIDINLSILIFVYILFFFSNITLSIYVFKNDVVVDFSVSILTLISIVVLYRINESIALKQIIFIGIGYITYLSMMLLIKDIRELYKFKWVYFALTIILMSVSFLIGNYVNGAKNWVSIFGITFQPSEFGKVFFVLYVTSVFREGMKKIHIYLVLFLIIYSILFLVLQKDLGTSIIIFGTVVFIYYIKTSRHKFIFWGIILSILGCGFSYIKFEHVKVRIISWLNPNLDPYGISYQTLQGFFSMASGGFVGRGLYGGSLELIPTNHTDYIFVSIVEEFGVITGIGIVMIYFIVFLRIALKSVYFWRINGASFFAINFILLISIQVILILGGILNLIPLTGVTLPLVSYGGSSITSTFIMMGIIQKTLGEFKGYE